jgi:hypothetical protein
VKEAVRAPVELIVHVGEGDPEKRFDPAGAVIVHGPALAAVNVPDTLAAVPVGPEGGEIVSVTATPFVKVAVPLSSGAAEACTLTVYGPLRALELTWNEPRIEPPA